MTSSPPTCLVLFESKTLDVFGGHRSYRNGDINSYIKSFVDTLEKVELTASIRHIARFLKSGIPIYNSEVPDTLGRKIRRRKRTQAIAKRFAFYANAIISLFFVTHSGFNLPAI